MNKVELTGRIANDLEIRKTQTNKSVLNFSLAVDRGYKKEDGTKAVDFIKIQVWDQKAEYLMNYAEKGSLVGVVGNLRVDTYQREGQMVTYYFINAEQVEIFTYKKEPSELVTAAHVDPLEDEDLPFV